MVKHSTFTQVPLLSHGPFLLLSSSDKSVSDKLQFVHVLIYILLLEKKKGFFFVPRVADEDHGEGERHFQRGQANGGGRALAGLSTAGVLQPGLKHKQEVVQ